MLTGISIRDIVLIEELDLSFGAGLTVLTGETGAGKSILLDSLGLATGSRADRALVRQGQSKGTVTAEFSGVQESGVMELLEDQGIDADGDQLILRRQITTDGKSRAWINDQPVGQALLSAVGDRLLEVHGQHDDRGLLSASAHRALLDSYGDYQDELKAVEDAYATLQAAEKTLAQAEADLAEVKADEEYILHAREELQALGPVAGEEEELSDRRALMMQGEKLSGELTDYLSDLSGRTGAESVLRGVLRRMERTEGAVGERMLPAIQALDRASLELSEAVEALQALSVALNYDPQEVDIVEERLFEIRRLARKHNCLADDLVNVLGRLENQATALSSGDDAVDEARRQLDVARHRMTHAVQALTSKRQEAASRLDALVTAEMPPLKLEKAQFRTRFEPQETEDWNQHGGEKIYFEVKTNPTTSFGPMVKVASGGELARFILALKVVLSEGDNTPVMVFDEVDKGIGGATASAVGERLSRLAERSQVLVVTHSPQVAACGTEQFLISKGSDDNVTRTSVASLKQTDRREEIARMLAGSEITDAARAAADQLLKAG